MHLAEVLLLAVASLVASFVVHRVQLLRRGGTEVVLRTLPSGTGAGWRHGVLRYREDEAVFFRVASVRPGSDRTVPRRTLELLDRRTPDGSELDVLPAGCTVVRFRVGGEESEIALDGGALTAFLSWVESSPPNRARRRGPGAGAS
jgi:hypothetical protein